MRVKARTVVELAESQCAEVTELRGSRAVDGERLRGVHQAVLIRQPGADPHSGRDESVICPQHG
jgi:hypothetical protein